MELYNSLTRKKELFTPINDKKVSLYVCGITPYDTTHLGHAFTYMIFDVLVRFLRYKKYEVTYVQNVTDIDDDILKRAKRDGKDWRELGKYWTDKFLHDLKTLNILLPTHYVKATDSIPKIIALIEALQRKGLAYESDGRIYFDASKYAELGKLSRYSPEQMKLLLKERGGNPDDPTKRNPLDFVLWQRSKQDEPFWESPWGKGRPGWHIECTAMIHQYLGEHIDIHGGGRDLIYPHHESEIVQSEAATGKKPYVKYWMHTAMLLYEGEKMAKSLGNLVMVSDLLKQYSPDAIRWVLLSHHYRMPWEFHEEELQQAQQIIDGIQTVVHPAKSASEQSAPPQDFIERMEDDLDTPEGLITLQGLVKAGETAIAHTCLAILGFCSH